MLLAIAVNIPVGQQDLQIDHRTVAKGHATQRKAKQSRAEPSRAEQSRAEQSRAEPSRAEHSRTSHKHCVQTACWANSQLDASAMHNAVVVSMLGLDQLH